MIYLGIDPGESGAIAWIDDNKPGYQLLKGLTEQDVLTTIYDLSMSECFAFIEQVHSMPSQGVVSVWKFSGSYHGLRMALAAAGIRRETVTPGEWQKEFGLLRKNKEETKTEKKNRHKARAQELFPMFKISHGNADALLISEYCRRVRS